jgi:HK97 family phage major capsid protein
MKNLDLLKQKKAEIMQKLNAAIKEGNEEAFTQAFTELTDTLQEAVLAEAKGIVQAADNTVLVGRGVRALTSEETQYYQAVIQAMRSTNPKQALTDIDIVFPKTVIDAVFEDLVEDHPLLEAIDFQNTSGLVEYIVNAGSKPLATWQALTATIVTELTRDFQKVDLAHKKLTAFIPVAKAMLDLGPVWLDRFVRAILGEAVYNGLEDGIVDGDGLLEPIGMNKNLAGAVDPTTGYPAKTKVPVEDFGPENYGGLISQLIVGPNGNIRTVREVILVVNPVDYLTKVMPATTQLINGTWVNNIFPFPTRVIQSAAVTQGSAIMGIGRKYFMGLGTQKSGKIEYSDEYHFLEDERVYLVKLYGTGRPVDNTAFLYLDISALKPNFPIVRTTNYVDTGLKSIVVEGGTLSPAFDKDVTLYSAAVEAAGDFTAVANDSNATVAVTLNGEAATNGGEQTWLEGQNIVMVTVTNAGNVKSYAVIVTYTVPEG